MIPSTYLGFMLLVAAGGPDPDPPPKPVPSSAKTAYAEILAKHVKRGLVDYAAIARTDRPKLDTYLEAVARAELPKDRNARMAFYIDAYNALVIRSIITHGRPRSVLDVEGFFKEQVHEVAHQTMSLDQLEKEHLNPFAKDPRTHFVLVCGAVGCPILETKPYIDTPLEARLETATQRYLHAPTGARLKDNAIALSKIFDWYKADFGGEDEIIPFVRKYLTDKEKTRIGSKPVLTFIDYNWTLNQQ